MRLTYLHTSLCLLIVCHVARPAHAQQPHHTRRSRRSGGYPKFPASPRGGECGTRSVPYHPHHSGVIQAKIVGGVTAPYGAHPWQVDIKLYRSLSGRYEHHCGGALVGERLVITAAHCLQSATADQLRVTTGEHNLNTADKHEQSFKVEKIVVHPDFRRAGPYSNDIALLKVKASNNRGGVNFNAHVRPICLPEVSAKSAVGTWCTVTGWGAQKPEDLESISPVLRAASVPLLDLATCRQDEVFGGRRQSILDSMVCAGLLEGGVDACGGDSGGPLACEINGRFVLTGLVSWGDGCAKRNRPGVYTRVSHFTSWIQTTVTKLGL